MILIIIIIIIIIITDLYSKLIRISYRYSSSISKLTNMLEFQGLLLYPWKFQTKHKASPLETSQNCVTHLGNLKTGLKPRPLIPYDFLLIIPGNSTLFLINPWKIHLLSSIPLEIPYSQPRLFVFFSKIVDVVFRTVWV